MFNLKHPVWDYLLKVFGAKAADENNELYRDKWAEHPLQTVYILYPFTLREERKTPISRFWAQNFADIDRKIQGLPVFLKPQSALHYARYFGGRFVVIEARVPECAIMGVSQGNFALKPGYLRKPYFVSGTYAWLSYPQPVLLEQEQQESC